ncbi:MAG: cytochrome c3 family protein [bacterium]
MRKKQSIPEFLIIIFVILLLLCCTFSGCSRATRHRILTIFFDGVPPLDQPSQTTAKDSSEQVAIAGAATTDTTIARNLWSFHPALEENECVTCHDPSQSYRLLEEPEKLCLTCHDDKADAEYVHAPVEEGLCLECHNPHGTKNPRFLVMSGQELCFQCHDEVYVKEVEIHEGIEDIVCYECHDSHSSEIEYLLR